MWPFHKTPTQRLHHRLLKRLRTAYLVTEDLPSHRLVNDNLKLIGEAGQNAADDEVLYLHWMGSPMPLTLAHASIVEKKAWDLLLRNVHELVTQGFHPDAYEAEAKTYAFIGHALQDLIQYELHTITHPDTKPDEATLRTIKARLHL